MGTMIVCSLLGACRTTYSIQGKEAVRALRMLGDGDASAKREKVVVRAQKAKSEESVWIELRSWDQVRLQSYPREVTQDIENREKWGTLDSFPADIEFAKFQFKEPLDLRGRLMLAGLGLTGVSLVAQFMSAFVTVLSAPDHATNGHDTSWLVQPYYGSYKIMVATWEVTSDQCAEGIKCGAGAFASFFTTLVFVAQVTGPLLSLASLFIPKDRLRDGPDDTSLSWTPNISPFAEGGLLLTWRF